MRLIAAELLKMRRRTMSVVLPVVLVIAMAVVFLVIGSFLGLLLRSDPGFDGPSLAPIGSLPFNVIYAIAGDFVFGLGSLFVIIYTGGIVGGDYSWGVLRNAFSRGESRIRYALAKAAALALGVALAAFVCLIVGAAMVLVGGAVLGASFGPLSVDAAIDFVKAFGLGVLVLLERGAIGFAVTVLLRSQIAGIVVGVILYIAEPFIAGLASTFAALGALTGGQPPSVHWSQYLPFTIGSSVLAEAHASLQSLTAGAGITATVPLSISIPVLVAYGVVAMAVACLIMRRQEIVA
jgi:ABC-type transport system involved in multi-copper enzyme maturation permease subunit